MDNETRQAFTDVKTGIAGLRKDFQKVVSGEMPCKPAVEIATLHGRCDTLRGKIKMLRLLWIPLSIAAGLVAVNLLVAALR